MTDQEIIERLASFMGWQYLPITEQKPDGVTIWYSRLDCSVCVVGEAGRFDFDPLHDPASCALVLDEARSRWPQQTGEFGRYWQIANLRNGNWSVMIREEDGTQNRTISRIEDASLWRAVCLAVLEAIDKG